LSTKDPRVIQNTSAGDISNYNKETLGGEKRENTISSEDYELKLAEYQSYFEDDFVDESNIYTENNIEFDSIKNEIRLAKSKNSFVKTYGGGYDDWGYDCKPTSDGGYIISGIAQSLETGRDACLIKTNSYGEEQWNITFGNEMNDWGYFVEETGDSGYIIGGYLENATTYDRNGFLLKTDSKGIEQWNKTYGGNKTDVFNDIAHTIDGGYILTGHKINFGSSYSDVWLVKVNENGIEQWNRTIGGLQSDYGNSVEQTTDGGYVIAGMTFSYGMGDSDLWVLKVNATGIETWNYTYGDDDRDVGSSIRQTSDGGYIIVGDTDYMGTYTDDALAIKLDSTGKKVWDRTYGKYRDDYFTSVLQTADNGYLMVGFTESFDANSFDGWLVKTDETGLEQWSRFIGGYKSDYFRSVEQTSDGGFIATGHTTSYGFDDHMTWLVKMNESGYCDVKGNYTSKVMSSKSISSLKSFFCSVKWMEFTKLTVQFSQDGISWYNSYYTKNVGDNLVNGNNTIGCGPVEIKGNEFYYKINFISTGIFTPSISKVNISINHYYESGYMESFKYVRKGDTKWKLLDFSSSIPDKTELKIQFRTAETKDGLALKSFVGPGGLQNSYYRSSPSNIWEGHTYDDWIQYKVSFKTDISSESAILHRITIYYEFLGEVPIPYEPGNNTWLKNNRPEFTWRYPTYKYDGQFAFQWQMDDDKNFSSINYDSGQVNSSQKSYTPDFNIIDGVWYWRVRITENGDDWTAYSENQTVKIDTTILAPINVTVTPSFWTSIKNITIDWESPEDLSGIEEGAYFYYGDEPPTNANYGSFQESKPIRMTGMNDGKYKFYIWLRDEARNYGFQSYSTGEYKVDTRAPSINIDSLDYDVKYEEGQSIEINAEVFDHLSGVDWVKIYYRNSSEDNYTVAPMNSISERQYTALIPGEIVHTEMIEFYIEASDKSYPPNKATRAYYGVFDPSTGKYLNGIDIFYPLEVISYSPVGNNVSVTTTINATFNHKMDEARISRDFSIVPEVRGHIIWENNSMVFTPDEPLKYDTHYLVTFDGDTEDDEGNTLGDDFQWSFRTEKGSALKSSEESVTVRISGLYVGFILLIIAIILILIFHFNLISRILKPEEQKFKPVPPDQTVPAPKPVPVTTPQVKRKRKTKPVPAKPEPSPLVSIPFEQSPIHTEFQTRPVECPRCGTYVNESDENCGKCGMLL
jgi:hypothetical protein